MTTTFQDDWTQRYLAGEDLADIATSANVTDATVFWHLNRVGVKMRAKRGRPLSVTEPQPVATPVSDKLIPPQPSKVFCVQRDRRITRQEAENCTSPFCKGECR